MKRVIALLILPVLLVLGGCSTILGTGDWDQVKVSYLSSADGDDYTLLVTPTEASYTLAGEASTHELPSGVWDLLTTGVRSLGDHTSDTCADGSVLTIEASAAGTVKQTFAASSCDADGLFSTAQSLIEQVVSRLK
ncbi:MAG: hypothetical protein KIT69_05860 [Propionibacteriaceae bacterium]|nr:hypothetical protein [Propionibacteriaceae bacterium]